ncbi:MAG: hypothetical protein KGL39_05535 [Patescibacteria group bacterium]|nr:hypothetical protein [Patescibacteria group bacterium]
MSRVQRAADGPLEGKRRDMLRVGVGAYPNAVANDIASTASGVVLVMGKTGDERHDFARVVRAALPDALLVRRHWEPDNAQVDFSLSPEDEADRWFGLVLGALTPDEFRALYDVAVGMNEPYDNARRDQWPWLVRFELRLCFRLQSVGIPYACIKAAPGNVDPDDLPKYFAPLLAVAACIADDNYCEPNATTIEDPAVPWYARRPFAWWQACKAAGIRFPPFLATETGTYKPWTQMPMGEGDYANLQISYARMFDQWRQAGMPVLAGPILFADGAEGTMGDEWNIGPSARQVIATWNRSVGMESSSKPQIPVTNVPWAGTGAWVWYVSQCGGLDKMIATAKAAGVQWLVVKMADGTGWGDQNNPTVFRDQFSAVCAAVKRAGIKCLAYQYVYGDQPGAEAVVASMAATLGADGLVIDAEYEYVNKIAAADTYFAKLWSLLPSGFPLSFAPDLRILVDNAKAPWNAGSVNLSGEPWPWASFLRNCQAIMPQLYWTDFQVTPMDVFDLVRVLMDAERQNGWTADTVVPILPSNGTASDIQAAVGLTKALGLKGASFWQLDNANVTVLGGINWMTGPTDAELSAIGEQLFFKTAGIPFNPTAALTAAWLDAWKGGNYLGRPRGTEFDAGRFRCQEFERNVAWAEINNWGNRGVGLATMQGK